MSRETKFAVHSIKEFEGVAKKTGNALRHTGFLLRIFSNISGQNMPADLLLHLLPKEIGRKGHQSFLRGSKSPVITSSQKNHAANHIS